MEVQARNDSDYEYVGFWSRVGATLIDTVILLVITLPLMYMLHGDSLWVSDETVLGFADVMLNYILPLIAVLLFWSYRSATPGKMAIKAIIVDANTGKKPTLTQYVIRYIGYIVSIIPLGLGVMWVGWDSRKQGWHDKLARTVVIRSRKRGVESIKPEK